MTISHDSLLYLLNALGSVYSYVYLLYMYTYMYICYIYTYIYIFVDDMHLHAERRGKCSAESSDSFDLASPTPSLSALRLKNAARNAAID